MRGEASAPAAITALASMLTHAPALAAVTVRDGPDLTNADAEQVITVGYIGPDDDTAAEAQMTGEGLGELPDREAYSIHCAIAVLTGESDPAQIPANRQAAFDLLAAVRLVIAGDHTLTGTVMKARVSSWTLRQDQTQGGFKATLRFDVAVEAFTTR